MVTHGKAARSARGRFASRSTTRTTPSTKQPALHTPAVSFSSYTTSHTNIEENANPIATANFTAGDVEFGGRPPSKLALTQPYGTIHQTIDGVNTDLRIAEAEKISKADALLLGLESTPSSARIQAKPVNQSNEKRVLRSQDGASRTRSDLAHFFPDYEDIVFGKAQEPGTASLVRYH